jgi:hypothetical protein
MAKLSALLLLAGIGLQIEPGSAAWWRDDEHRRTTIPKLTAVLDGYQRFTVVAVHPYPAFPTAIYTRADYVGMSNSHWFLPAVAQSGGANRIAVDNATRQAVLELSRKPEIVVVDRDWRRHTTTPSRWNGMDFLISQPAVASLWKPYHYRRTIGGYDIYVREAKVGVTEILM